MLRVKELMHAEAELLFSILRKSKKINVATGEKDSGE